MNKVKLYIFQFFLVALLFTKIRKLNLASIQATIFSLVDISLNFLLRNNKKLRI